MNERITIVDGLKDSRLFGSLPAFRDLSTWGPWIVALKVSYGLKLDADELSLFQKCTGRQAPRDGGYPEIVFVVARRGGKDRIVSVIGAFEAITREPNPDGTDVYVLVVCQDSRAAMRTTFGYLRALFETIPILAAQLESITQDTIRLKNRVVIAVYPCRSQSVRGVEACVGIVNELAHFTSTDNVPQDKNMLQAIRPTLATTSGKLIILSSPYSQSGELWNLHQKHFGKDDSQVLVWQASADCMNPTLPTNYLERMRIEDPEAYLSEVAGEFRSGLSTFLDSESIQACVATGIRERPYVEGVQHLSYADTAAGRGGGGDAFVVVVARVEGERAVLVAVRVWRPPFNPSGVIQEACAFFKSYRVYSTTGDNYASQFPAEQFRLNGIQYITSTRNRSEIYLELLPLINSERVVLLDHPELLRELRGLERKRGTSGKDRVDHSSRAGSHDDIALACAGALVEASMPALAPGVFVL